MSEEKKILGYYDYTVLLTYIGMLSGVTGIILATENHFSGSVICLMVAGLCDMFDGLVASTKKNRKESEKKFGIQIDSLSDLICFGVLPGMFVYQFSEKIYAGIIVAALYILCALIRLAYFNVCEEERQKTEGGTRKYYQGMPVTSAALLLPGFFLLTRFVPDYASYMLISVIAVMGILFLSPFRLKKPKAIGKIIIGIIGIVEFFILILGVIDKI